MPLCAHFAEKFGVLNGAEEERDSRVKRGRERPETCIARVRRGAGRGREERGVVVREKKEKGMNYLTNPFSQGYNENGRQQEQGEMGHTGLGRELRFSKTT